MATRHNACINPACANDVTGWGGASTPTRTAVTGFDRPYAARYTSGTYATTAPGAVTAGLPHTLSVYAYFDVEGVAGGVTYIEWRRADNSVITYSNANFSVPGQQVVRLSNTATAPDEAAEAALIVEFGFGGGAGDLTMVLIEAGSDLNEYFDGDSDGAFWDGTPGNSSSTLPELVPAALGITLPAAGATATGVVTNPAVLDTALPALTATATGTVHAAGQLDAELPRLDALLTGHTDATAALDAALPPAAATLTGLVTEPVTAELTAELPRLDATLAGVAREPAVGELAAVLPALRAAVTGVSDAAPPTLPPLLVRPPRLAWPSGRVRLGAQAGLPRLGG